MSGMADVSVRPARPDDAAAIAQIQLSVWRQEYAELLPEAALASLSSQQLADSWRQAAQSPPSPHHHLLVALDGDTIVGFAASAPAEDPYLDPQVDAELLALHISPDAIAHGHGSRLLAAAVDHWLEDGFSHAVTWVFARDEPLRRFLEGAGWADDGAIRTLEPESEDGPVEQIRLATQLLDEA
jgi:GNAT superfamily N-acetyltransferase